MSFRCLHRPTTYLIMTKFAVPLECGTSLSVIVHYVGLNWVKSALLPRIRPSLAPTLWQSSAVISIGHGHLLLILSI